MILSVSRRTDVPDYYSEWFLNRIRAGFLYVRNPMNAHQISCIDLSPDIVDCIVFWTKNPADMIPRLDELKEYQYYFQFTLTGYGRDIEPNLPAKREVLIATFQKLSDKIGRDRVIWRYDPILINDRYTADYHLKAFAEIAQSLKSYTGKVVISFVDFYDKIKRNTETLHIKRITDAKMCDLAKGLAKIANDNQLIIETCAEEIELQHIGIQHGCCVDKELIENIIGCKLKAVKDKNQREACGCIESVEVGTYNTCQNGCRYCYANFSGQKVRESIGLYDADSPLLCGVIGAEDKVTKRKIKSFKEGQLNFLDD